VSAGGTWRQRSRKQIHNLRAEGAGRPTNHTSLARRPSPGSISIESYKVRVTRCSRHWWISHRTNAANRQPEDGVGAVCRAFSSVTIGPVHLRRRTARHGTWLGQGHRGVGRGWQEPGGNGAPHEWQQRGRKYQAKPRRKTVKLALYRVPNENFVPIWPSAQAALRPTASARRSSAVRTAV
jgi:hypothetical protein